MKTTEKIPKPAETVPQGKSTEKLPRFKETFSNLPKTSILRFLWDNILLPFTVMCLLANLLCFFEIANPNMILITGLAVFTSLHGYGAGVVCTLVMTLYSMYFFSDNHTFFNYSPVNLQKLFVVVLGALLNVLCIGRLKNSQEETSRQLIAMNQILKSDNQSLKAASLIDDLTGTRNRFAFRRDYKGYEGRQIHVMMFDLDDFKRTNDTYGHAIGDYVLKHTGRILREHFGDACCYRYGGDEFLVVCPGMAEKAFAAKVERTRLEMRAIALDGQGIPAFFSAGYVYGQADLSIDLRLMLRQADHNLYRAKELGKNGAVGCAYSRPLAQELEKSLVAEGKNFADLTEQDDSPQGQ